MQFDFDTMLDRVGKDAMALEALGMPGGFAPGTPKDGFSPLPMWVADMNFATAPAITRAIIERAQHPAFGYYFPSDAYFESIIAWHGKRHGLTGLEPQHIGYENGVLGGLASALGAFTSPGEKVLLATPTYVGFQGCIKRAGRTMERSPLVRDDADVWRMDFADMERRIVDNGIRLAIMCSPYNPCGRVWERGELEAAAQLFEKHGIIVVADEIWHDLVRPGVVHTPFQSVSDYARTRTIALHAPSKTFNLAGLVGSYHIMFDDDLRARLETQGQSTCYNDMNVLSMHALIGAYSEEGAAWVDELVQVLAGNIDAVCDYVDATEGLEAFRPQGTYMIFVDCTRWCADHGWTIDQLEQALWDVGVAVQDGRMFGGACHIRMNVALPAAKVREAIERIDRLVLNG